MPRACGERGVFRHVVKNAAPTALAVMGLQFGYLLGGSILIETVFSWPGTGFLLNTAIFQRDLPLLQGTILVLAMFFVLLNLAVDVLQTASIRASSEADDGGHATTIGPNLSVPAVATRRPRLLEGGRPPAAARPGHPVRCARSSLLIVLAAIFAPLLAPADPYKGSMIRRLKPLGYARLSGSAPTNSAATCSRRLIYGGRLSLFMGMLPVCCAFVIGGRSASSPAMPAACVNTLIMRTMDVFYAFPSVLLAIAISGALGAGIVNAILALTLVFIPPIAARRRKRHHPGAQSATSSRRRAPAAPAPLDHHPRARARQCARADLRLCDQPDQRLDDPRVRPVASSASASSRRSRSGA